LAFAKEAAGIGTHKGVNDVRPLTQAPNAGVTHGVKLVVDAHLVEIGFAARVSFTGNLSMSSTHEVHPFSNASLERANRRNADPLGYRNPKNQLDPTGGARSAQAA